MKPPQTIDGSNSSTIAKTVEPQKLPTSVMPPAPPIPNSTAPPVLNSAAHSISNSAAHPPRPPSANLNSPSTEAVVVKEEDFYHYNSKLTIQDFDLLKVRIIISERGRVADNSSLTL